MDEHTNKTGQGRRADHAPEPYQPEPGAIFTLAGRLPEGWQWRVVAQGRAWGSHPCRMVPEAFVEARPIPKPPLMVPMDRDVVDLVLNVWGTAVEGSLGGAVAACTRAALAAESES